MQHPQRSEMAPIAVRSRLMLELASELVGGMGWPYRQAKISLRSRTSEGWDLTLFASDSPEGIMQMAQGEVHLAIVNPGVILNLAIRGTGPFKEPVPVRAIAVMHSYDQFVLGVAGQTGLTSLEDIREKRYPLRVSLRADRNHSIHLVVDEVLKAAGFSLDDLRSWGGEVHYDPGVPMNNPRRIGAVERGEVDAIFDEVARGWRRPALELGMRFLPIDEGPLERLESIGFRRSLILADGHPEMTDDVPTIDYSGFIIYTHADVEDATVRAFCEALDLRRDTIPSDEGHPPLPVHLMCKDTREGPLDIPLHPAAEAFWRERGYLDPAEGVTSQPEAKRD